MQPGQFSGSYPLFRFFDIRVYLHWSWFIMAAVLVELRTKQMGMIWQQALLEVLALFGIVLLHEFGHALACKSVGGEAKTIVLWPLGGVAFVKPPQRPWPVLWSLVAGPLVNVVLVPVTYVLMASTDHELARAMFLINFVLLIFNMLPFYPLDGGQILQTILWMMMNRWRAMQAASAIGVAGAIALAVLGFNFGQYFLIFMAFFVGSQAMEGFRVARELAEPERRLGGPIPPVDES